MKRIAKKLVHPVILSLGALVSHSAQAQQATESAQGFAINRYNPAERGSQWFALESLDLRGHVRPAVGATLDLAYKPLVVYKPDGSEDTTVINTQFFAHIGASLVLWDRLRFGINFPFALQQSGERGTVGPLNVAAPSGAALGDLRLGGDVRLFGKYGDPITLALGVQLFAPTGNRAAFTGDETFRVLPRLSAAGNYGVLTYAAMLGVQYRGMTEGFVDTKTGTEFAGGASIGVKALGDRLVVGPELYGSTIISGTDDVKFKQPRAPLEVILGAHYTVGQFRVGAGVGPGLTRGVGTPALRAVASVEWVPGVVKPVKRLVPTPDDRDGDGIYDIKDACPDIPGVASDNAQLHGCPVDEAKGVLVSIDRDKDRVIDEADKCPDVPGLREPPAQLTAEQKSLWELKYIGCPDDIDGDKIANIPDACPTVPGQPHKDPARHGCPLVFVSECQIKIMDRIYFKTGSDKLETIGEKGKLTQAVLQAVVDVLKANPKITRIEVQGHASQDTYAKNQTLSEQRAASVVKWLIERSIEPGRLVPHGYGTTRPAQGVPVDKKNKELHQRVEFHILEPTCEAK
jgi:OmpA-OmpF porin, OOP family